MSGLKYTAPVRRGFGEMMRRRLAEHAERAIEMGTAAGLKRDERMTTREVADLRAAVAWMAQEAASEEGPTEKKSDDDGAAGGGAEAGAAGIDDNNETKGIFG